jgi:diguanylate cyclase (GGDEF)-like protein
MVAGTLVLNQDTLLLVQVCITLLTTVLLVTSALYVECPPEQRWWAGGNVIVSLGLALTNIDGLPPLVSAVAGYGVLALGMGLVLRGLRLYCNALLHWRWIALMVALALVFAAYFTYAEPSLRARLSISGFYFALLNWLCAVVLLRSGGWRGVAVAVVGFLLLGLALFLRGTYLLFHADTGDNRTSIVIAVCLLAISLAQVCISFGLILMVMWRYSERLRQLSTLDPLTGALNRAGLEIQGGRVAQRTLRGGRSLAVIMIDADHFKVINDTYGHPVGDEVLRHLARLLKAELRPHDLLARYGGEEFVLVLDGLNLDDALKVADRVRSRIEAELVGVEHISVRYTASVGVASSDEHGYDLIRLISAGDAAMYSAKRAGRNRVMCA